MNLNNLPVKLRREAKHAWQNCRAFTGLHESFFKRARGCRIITYHGVCKRDHKRFNDIFLREDIFEKHLQFYQKYFHVVSLAEFYAGDFDKNKFNLCITFDDGYFNNYQYVLPLMEKYGLPISFFITAIREEGCDILWNDYLGIITKYGPREINFRGETFIKEGNNYLSNRTKRRLRDMLQEKNFNIKKEMMQAFENVVLFRDKKEDEEFWLQMNVNEIGGLATSPYATIGSHGYYHNDLSNLSNEDCRNELAGSKRFLENICGHAITALAFPYGSYSKAVIEEAKKAGYNKLLALDIKDTADTVYAALKERMIINPYISVINQMYAIVKGSYE